jgi:hypothetical protein
MAARWKVASEERVECWEMHFWCVMGSKILTTSRVSARVCFASYYSKYLCGCTWSILGKH